MSCKLDKMFQKRLSFIRMMQEMQPGSYPSFPLDMSKKESQQVCRDLALRGVEEMFEALGHLKNWKSHRSSEEKDIDREEFLEEIIDSFNYFFSLLILMNVDESEFINAFNAKDEIIRERIRNGY